MDVVDLLLREHAAVHTNAVAESESEIGRLLDGLSDEQWRARPHGLNSMAWLFWHIARVEDACVSVIVASRPQLLDEAWAARLQVDRRDHGEGMSTSAVAELSATIDVAALREYRDEVGRRTRGHVAELWPSRWEERISKDDVRNAVDAGILPDSAEYAEYVAGQPREALLIWWGLHHTIYHLGQAATVRGRLLADRPD